MILEGQYKLPEWCEGLRPHQTDAVVAIVDAYKRGVDLVLLDAPTGSGKTLIAEVVRQVMGFERTFYLCSSLTLQDQFEEDFRYAKVAKGRSNYRVGSGRTAADCSGVGCELCPGPCPYQVAKEEVVAAPLGVLNTTYALHHIQRWPRDFVVIDECDVLESELLAHDTIRIPRKWLKMVGEEVPKKGAHAGTIRQWLAVFEKRASALLPRLDEAERRSLRGLVATIRRMRAAKWVRSYEEGSGLVLKPVWVEDRAEGHLWAHGSRYLMMSGSIVDPDRLIHDVGYSGSWERVEVPMTFPEENRLIYFPPSGRVDMTYKNKDRAWPQVAEMVSDLARKHPESKILVHSVSYALGKYLYEQVDAESKFFYANAGERARVLEQFRYTDGGVMFAASFDRGVDLPEVDVVVVPKIPYPNLKDPVVSEKLHSGKEGQLWYDTQTVRTLLQMTGRHVRSKTDVGVTVILDNNFRRLMKNNRRMFPSWWRESVRHVELEI